MIQLNYETLAIVICIAGVLSSSVMMVLWKIDKLEKGLGVWALAASVGAVGFLVLLFNPLLGDYATFLNNICTLTAPLLILEGVLRFREYNYETNRKRIIPIIILFFVVISYINADDITTRYLFHDIIVALLFSLSAFYFIYGIKGVESRVCLVTVLSLAFISAGFLYRWVLAINGDFKIPGLKHPFMGILFLIIILWVLGWTYGVVLVVNYRSQQRIMRMAEEDNLTGLANRKNLNDTMTKLIFESKVNDEKYYVYMLDLNGFKMINDNYGHAFGDQVLVFMARAFKNVVRKQDFTARLGGDEFVCIIKADDTHSEMNVIKERLRAAVEKVNNINGLEIQLRTSIGCSVIPQDGSTVDDILDKADKLMYLEKIEGRPMSKIINRKTDIL